MWPSSPAPAPTRSPSTRRRLRTSITPSVPSTPWGAPPGARATAGAPGAPINSDTPPLACSQVTDELDLVLCMSVNPGWGGQPFIPSALAKLAELRSMLADHIALEVDGG